MSITYSPQVPRGNRRGSQCIQSPGNLQTLHSSSPSFLVKKKQWIHTTNSFAFLLRALLIAQPLPFLSDIFFFLFFSSEGLLQAHQATVTLSQSLPGSGEGMGKVGFGFSEMFFCQCKNMNGTDMIAGQTQPNSLTEISSDVCSVM